MLSVSAAFGASVMLGIYMTGHISGAHLNPAVTMALFVNNPESTPADIVGPYIAAQCAGATIAGAMNYLMFSGGIAALEASEGLVRGAAGSEAIFNGAFGMVPNGALVGTGGLVLAEIGMTAALLFMICGITDPDSSVPDGVAPVLIGTTVATIVGVGGPVTGEPIIHASKCNYEQSTLHATNTRLFIRVYFGFLLLFFYVAGWRVHEW
jgi:glycerol uptake facilitator protein